MNIYRPERFDEVRGNKKIISFITERIISNTFPQFSLLFGEEGIGKTTLSKLIALGLNCQEDIKPCYKCESCLEINNKVIRQNLNTNEVLTFKMSVDGGLQAAKEVLSNLNTTYSKNGVLVVILEECHRMNAEAQDALLTQTEYLPEGVYIIACTTDISKLQKTFLSRAVMYNLNRLTPAEIVKLLSEEASRRNLIIQGGDAVFEIIATWSECKPRAALKVLEAMGENSTVSLQDIKDFISFLDTREIIPIISSFAGSVIVGLEAIEKLPIDMNTHNSLIMLLEETIKISFRQKSRRISNEDYSLIKEAVADVDQSIYLKFLYEVAAINQFSKVKLIAAYLKCHPALHKVEKHDDNVLQQEMSKKMMTESTNLVENDVTPRLSLKELIMKGERLE